MPKPGFKTISVKEPLYSKIKKQAEAEHRTVAGLSRHVFLKYLGGKNADKNNGG